MYLLWVCGFSCSVCNFAIEKSHIVFFYMVCFPLFALDYKKRARSILVGTIRFYVDSPIVESSSADTMKSKRLLPKEVCYILLKSFRSELIDEVGNNLRISI